MVVEGSVVGPTLPALPIVSVPAEALERYVPSLVDVINAELAGLRPRCACEPILAWPGGGPVVGYASLCPEHGGPPALPSGGAR